MEKTIVTTGPSVDEAIEAALAQLGLERDNVSVQVLAREKAGFLGFGKAPAKVQVTYEAEDPAPAPEAPKSALGSTSRSKPKITAIAKPDAPAKKPAPQPAVQPKQPAAQPKQPIAKAEKPRKEHKEVPVKEPKVYTPAQPGSLEESIERFLKGLLENMGSQAVPHASKQDETTYDVELVGEDLGYLIGRRGDTLDAIQHLCNYSINRNLDGHIRINVDAEAYRQKREESLRRYARKKAQQVLKAHRRTTLEPMNAYERHVIHATLQEMDRITTYSVGTEPNRRVVIEYVR